VTRDHALVEPSTDHSLSHSHPLPVPFHPLCPPHRPCLYPFEAADNWEQPGVVRSLKVLSAANFLAQDVETSASQNPEHGSDEKDKAEDQSGQRHIDGHALGRSARLDLLTR
jgi:hypothetical protein